MAKIRGIFLGALLVVGVGAGAAYVALHGADGRAQVSSVKETATKVALAKVMEGPYVYYVESIGNVEASQQVTLSAEIGGHISEILFDSGHDVHRGQILLRINAGPEQAELIGLRAQLASASAQWERAKELIRSGATSQRSFDEARAAYDSAHAAVERTVATINQKTIRAPFTGALGIRLVHLGQYLQPGTPIATLTGDAGTRVDFMIAETDAARLRVGMPVEVSTDAYPDRIFTGSIIAVDPQLNDSHVIAAQALMSVPARALRPGMYARVKVGAEERNELTVPESAVTYNSYGPTVFRTYVDDKRQLRVRRANIKTGERRDGRIVVTAGLGDGDSVVTSGQLRLSDGVLVGEVPDTIALDAARSTAR